MLNLRSINELTLSVECDGQGVLFAKKGAMIGFYGDVKFDKVVLGPEGGFQGFMGQMARRITGENIPLMRALSNGPSEVYYACQAQHVTVVALNPGETLYVESEDLLAFTDSCKYELAFLGCGVISQKGFCTTKLTGNGPDAQVAVLSNGNPIVMDTPCKVDPDAMVAFTGPEPQLKTDISWKTFLGQSSGESYMFDYTVPGGKVIVQPFERNSGVDVRVDSGRRAYVQSGPTIGNFRY